MILRIITTNGNHTFHLSISSLYKRIKGKINVGKKGKRNKN